MFVGTLVHECVTLPAAVAQVQQARNMQPHLQLLLLLLCMPFQVNLCTGFRQEGHIYVSENVSRSTMVFEFIASDEAGSRGSLVGRAPTIPGQGGWSGGAVIGALVNDFSVTNVDGTKGDEKITQASAFSGSQSWRLSRGLVTGGYGSPFSPGLDLTAGSPNLAADGNAFYATLHFKPVIPGDGSSVGFGTGTPKGDGFGSNYVVLRNEDSGTSVETRSHPGLDGAHHGVQYATLATLNSSWHRIEMFGTFDNTRYSDFWRYRIDGNLWSERFAGYYNFVRDATNQTKQLSNRLKFVPGSTDLEHMGFYFDDIFYGVFHAKDVEVVDGVPVNISRAMAIGGTDFESTAFGQGEKVFELPKLDKTTSRLIRWEELEECGDNFELGLVENHVVRVSQHSTIDYETRTTHSIIFRGNYSRFIQPDNWGDLSQQEQEALLTPPASPTWGSFRLNVSIVDSNEPPLCEDTFLHVDENTAVGVVLTSNFMIQDPDFPPQHHRYSIAEANGWFTVSPNGTVTVSNSSAYNYEVLSSAEFSITVEDSGKPPQSGNCYLHIAVLDKEDAPFFVGASEFSVDENTAGETAVAQILAVEEDAGQNVTYHLETEGTDEFASMLFALDSEGYLYVSDGELLDYEVLAASLNKSTVVFDLNISITDNGPSQLRSWKIFTMEVNDINDSPLWEHPVINLTLPENLPGGTVLLPSALSRQDQAGFISSETNYLVSDQDEDPLEFVLISGEDFIAIDADTGSWVLQRPELNFEKRNSYVFVVEAIDAGGLASQVKIHVSLMDMPDTPVVVDQTITLLENSTAGTVVAHILCWDEDAVDNATLHVEVLSVIPRGLVFVQDPPLVYISNDSQTHRWDYQLDFEQSNELNMVVQATDQSGRIGVGSITFHIVNSNDVPFFKTLLDQDCVLLSLTENPGPGTLIASHLAVHDDDVNDSLRLETTEFAPSSTNPQNVSYGANDGFIAVNPNSGEIRTRSPAKDAFDFESSMWYNFTITLTDDGNPAKSSMNPICLRIRDENEPPYYADEPFVVVHENTTIGPVPGAFMAANDPENNRLRYSLLGTKPLGGPFGIDPNTSQLLLLLDGLDAEEIREYELSILVQEIGTAEAHAVLNNITVHVLGVNEPPELRRSINEPLIIRENTAPSTNLGVPFLCVDQDLNSNPQFHLAGGGGAQYFSIEAYSGVLKTSSIPIDFEQTEFLEIEVTCQDHEFSVSKSLQIQVLDMNEHAPVLLHEPRIVVEENTPFQQVVHQFESSDMDLGDDVYYFLADTEYFPYFQINNKTGAVSVHGVVDYESNQGEAWFTLHLVDSHPSFPWFVPNVNSINISVIILDNNDYPFWGWGIPLPSFEHLFSGKQTLGSVTVSERAAAASEVHSFSGFDPDSNTLHYQLMIYYPENDRYSAPFTQNLAIAPFGIDPRTGVLRVVGPLDFEARANFEFLVRMTDSGSPARTTTGEIVIWIEDKNDPFTFKSPLQATVVENANPGQPMMLGELGRDEDARQEWAANIFALCTETTIHSHLLDDDAERAPAGLFYVAPTTGHIFIHPNASVDIRSAYLDFETSRTPLQLLICATDAADPSIESAARIEVFLLDVGVFSTPT